MALFCCDCGSMYKYFVYYKDELEYELSDDYLEFNAADITEDRYLKFAESYFEDQFQHREAGKVYES